MTIFGRFMVAAVAVSLLATVPSAQRRSPLGVLVPDAVHHDLSRRLGDVVPADRRLDGERPGPKL